MEVEQLEAPPTEELEQPAETLDEERPDPQAELLEQNEPEPAPPQVNPEVLSLIERQQQIIEQLQRGNQPQPEAPAPIIERLKARGMDAGTAKLFSEFFAEAVSDLKGQFLERDYGVLLHDVAQNTYQRNANEDLRRAYGATEAEMAALPKQVEAVRKEFGNLPLKAANELALTRLRSMKSAPGLSAARQSKQDGLKSMTPPIKGGSAKTVPDKLSQDEYDKMSEYQKTAYLNGLDPSKYADL